METLLNVMAGFLILIGFSLISQVLKKKPIRVGFKRFLKWVIIALVFCIFDVLTMDSWFIPVAWLFISFSFYYFYYENNKEWKKSAEVGVEGVFYPLVFTEEGKVVGLFIRDGAERGIGGAELLFENKNEVSMGSFVYAKVVESNKNQIILNINN